MRNCLSTLLPLFLLLTLLLPPAYADETERLEQLREKRQELVQQLKPLENMEEKLSKEVEAAQVLYQSLGEQKNKLQAVQLWNTFVTFMGGYFDLLQKTNPGNHAGVALVSFLQDRAGDELKKREPDFQMKLERASSALKQVQPCITRLNHAMNMTPQQVADQLHVRGMVDNSWVQRWQQTPDEVAKTKAVVSGKITFILEELNATRNALYAVRTQAGSLLPSIIKQRTLLQRDVDGLYREIRQLAESIALEERLEKISVDAPPDPADERKLEPADVENASPMDFAEAFALIESAWLSVLDGSYSRQDFETAAAFAQEARRKKTNELLKPFLDEWKAAYPIYYDTPEYTEVITHKAGGTDHTFIHRDKTPAGVRYLKAKAELEKKKAEVAKADQEGFITPREELEATLRSYEARVRDFSKRLTAFLDPPLVPGRSDDRNLRHLPVDQLFGSALYGLSLDLEAEIIAADQALTDSSLHELAGIVAAKADLYDQYELRLEELEVDLKKVEEALDAFSEGVVPFVEEFTPEMLNMARFFGIGVKWYDPDELWENLRSFAPKFQSLRGQLPKPDDIGGKLSEARSRNQRLKSLLNELNAAGQSARELFDVERRLVSIYRNFESDGYRPSHPYRRLERFDNANRISAAVNDELRSLLEKLKDKEVQKAYALTLITSNPDFSRSNKERYPEPQRLNDIGQQRSQLLAEIEEKKSEYERLHAEYDRSSRVLDEQLSNLARRLLPISPLWAYQADITQFAPRQAPDIALEDPRDFPAGDDGQGVFNEYVALVETYQATVDKAVKKIVFDLSDEEIAAEEQAVEDPSESLEEIRQREQLIGDFYASFRAAYEGKNESLVMSLIHDDWSAAGGVTLFDLEDNLRNMYNVFDDIQYDLSGLQISRDRGNLYKVNYSVTIRGQIYDNDLRHEEVSAVVEQVIIEDNRVKIYKTLNGNYWSIQ